MCVNDLVSFRMGNGRFTGIGIIISTDYCNPGEFYVKWLCDSPTQDTSYENEESLIVIGHSLY